MELNLVLTLAPQILTTPLTVGNNNKGEMSLRVVIIIIDPVKAVWCKREITHMESDGPGYLS